MNKLFKLCAFALMITSLSGCSKQKKSDKLKILCTTFPIYDWTLNITKNIPEAEVSLLMTKGTDLHNFQPSVEDIVKISESDIFIYNGGESEEWIKDVLKNSPNKNLVAINLMKNLTQDKLIREDVDPFLYDIADNYQIEKNNDEHIWLSLELAQISATIIERNICESQKISDDSRIILKSNIENYTKEIFELKLSGLELRRKNPVKIVVADRNPFVYLARDFLMEVFAAFDGCSAETEASFETIIDLTEKIKKHNINTIFVTESSDKKIAQTISKASKKNLKIEVLDSMQSVNEKDIKSGATYIGIMKKNIETLLKAVK